MASYLQLRPSGYYFRYVLPTHFQTILCKRELKYALKTSSRLIAKKRASYAGASIGTMLDRLRSCEIPLSQLEIQELVDTHVKSTLNKLRADSTTSGSSQSLELLHHTYAKHAERRPPLGNEIAKETEQPECQRKRQIQSTARTDNTRNASTSLAFRNVEPDNSRPTLSTALESYFTEKRKANSWSAKTEAQVVASLSQVIEILSDIPIITLHASHARQWKEVLLRLPPNYNKLPRFRNLSATESAELNDGPTISINTFNSAHTRVNAFFRWAFRHGYIDRNYFDGLKLTETKRAKDKRAAFTDEDLIKIFATEQYTTHTFKHPHYYWIPLLGLHTGARLEELCQLYLEDVKQVEEIWCIEIGDSREDQKTKTDSSKRLVPIHSKLVELGLLEYVDKLKQQGAERLFPDLKRERDGYSQSVSKWFTRYRRGLGMVGLEPKKDFHSFRHTLTTRLKQTDIPESIAAALIGHSNKDGITYGRYGKDYLINQVQQAVEALTFAPSLVAVSDFTNRS